MNPRTRIDFWNRMNCFRDPAIGERELLGKKADPQNKQVEAGGIDQL